MSVSAETAGFDAVSPEAEESDTVEDPGWDVGDTSSFVSSAAAAPVPNSEGPAPTVPNPEGPAAVVPNPEGPAPADPNPEGPTPADPNPEGPATAVPNPEGPAPAVPNPEGPAEVDGWGTLMGGWLKEQHNALKLKIKVSNR